MKYAILFFALITSTFTFSQTITADIIARGGPIVSLGNTLNAPLTISTELCNDTTGNCGTATGSLALQTGTIASGDYQSSATFNAGGSFVLTAADGTDSLSFSGTITSANWSGVKLANSTYTYTLTGTILDSTTGQTGAFALVTQVIGPANQKFPGNATVNYISIHTN